MRRAVILLLFSVGCQGQARETKPANSRDQAHPLPPVVDAAELPPLRSADTLPMLPDGTAVPEAYADGRARWQTATTTYAHGDAHLAGEAFLAVADALHDETAPEPIARTMAAGRCIAYENAARAFSAAQEFSLAKDRLLAARDQDPACRHTLTAMLQRVHREQLHAGYPPLWLLPI